ncbi:Uncharacterised protein [uncultured archaeon]|nr:Uncharacterised protein [uncultured archaeon]
MLFTTSKMLKRESSTGMTKHAESCPRSVPAFMSVGEFGRKSRFTSAFKNSSSDSGSRAMDFAMRLNKPRGVSMTSPFSSFCRYRLCITLMALTPSFNSSLTPKNSLAFLICERFSLYRIYPLATSEYPFFIRTSSTMSWTSSTPGTPLILSSIIFTTWSAISPALLPSLFFDATKALKTAFTIFDLSNSTILPSLFLIFPVMVFPPRGNIIFSQCTV